MVLPTIEIVGKLIFKLLLSAVLAIIFSSSACAQTPMKGSNYRIEPAEFEIPVSKITKVSNIRTFGSYSFGISESLIDFGKLLPTNPVERENILTIKSTDINYFVKVYENHQLLSQNSGNLIPDTTCDKGDCSELSASIWNSSLSYGFGYRCEGAGFCDEEFKNPDSYKQISNNSKGEIAQGLNRQKSDSQKLKMIYKVNISSQQKAGAYSNIVTFLFLPKY